MADRLLAARDDLGPGGRNRRLRGRRRRPGGGIRRACGRDRHARRAPEPAADSPGADPGRRSCDRGARARVLQHHGGPVPRADGGDLLGRPPRVRRPRHLDLRRRDRLRRCNRPSSGTTSTDPASTSGYSFSAAPRRSSDARFATAAGSRTSSAPGTRDLEREGELRAKPRGRGRARADRGRASGRRRQRGERDGGAGRGACRGRSPPARPSAPPSRFTLIEETGRDALAEMRRLLGVLRHDEDKGALAPQPTLAQAGLLSSGPAGWGSRWQSSSRASVSSCRPGSTSPPTASSRRRLTPPPSGGEDGRPSSSPTAMTSCDWRSATTGPQPSREVEPLRRDRHERLRLYGGRVRAEPRDDAPGQLLLARMPLEGVSA